MKLVGIFKLGRQGTARDVAGEGREGAGKGIGRQRVLVEVFVEHGFDRAGPQPIHEPVPGPDRLGEKIVLRGEMGIEGASGEAGRQHDVVDVGAGVPAQAEQPSGVF